MCGRTMWDRNSTRKAATLLTFGLALAACSASSMGEPTEAERRARIEEMVAAVSESFPEVPGTDAEQVARDLEAGRIVLVDSRPEAERRVSMIPGAISREELARRSEELAGSTLVTYCTIGHRSSEHARELRRQGWDARNFRGSLLAWTHAGGALVDAEGKPTRRLHVYGPRWDLAADGYETVW